MKKIFLVLLSLAFTACASPPPPKKTGPDLGPDGKPIPAVISSEVKGDRLELSVVRDKSISVSFRDSPSMDESVGAYLTGKGYRVAPKDNAQVAISIFGLYNARGGGIQEVKVQIGKIMEQIATVQKQDALVTQSAQGALLSTHLYMRAMQTGLLNNAVGVGNIVDTIGRATGIAGAFNKALTGDPRGICGSKCEDWHKVKQEASLTVKVKDGELERSRKISKFAFDEQLVPDQLIAALIDDVLKELE
jgi:uncharacterized lipoprotein YajG